MTKNPCRRRFSGGAPEMQSLPRRGPALRPAPSVRLIEVDYSEIELRVLALYSGDQPTHD